MSSESKKQNRDERRDQDERRSRYQPQIDRRRPHAPMVRESLAKLRLGSAAEQPNRDASRSVSHGTAGRSPTERASIALTNQAGPRSEIALRLAEPYSAFSIETVISRCVV